MPVALPHNANTGLCVSSLRVVLKTYIATLLAAFLLGGLSISLYGHTCGLFSNGWYFWNALLLTGSPWCQGLNWLSHINTLIVGQAWWHSLSAIVSIFGLATLQHLTSGVSTGTIASAVGGGLERSLQSLVQPAPDPDLTTIKPAFGGHSDPTTHTHRRARSYSRRHSRRNTIKHQLPSTAGTSNWSWFNPPATIPSSVLSATTPNPTHCARDRTDPLQSEKHRSRHRRSYSSGGSSRTSVSSYVSSPADDSDATPCPADFANVCTVSPASPRQLDYDSY